MAETLLEIKDLKKYYELKSGFLGRDRRVVKAVDGITLALKEGEILGVVGESGCGKSTLGRSILRLIEPTDGEILFDGKNIRALKKEELRQERSNMQIIFQDPGASLNPRMTVGEIIGEPIELFGTETGEAKEEKIYKLMDLVGINRSYIHRFPHEFSGGQRQRIGIARALAVDPKLIICDEPVSALEVSIQAQILNLLMDLQEQRGLTYMFITHNLSVVKHISNEIMVMYLGQCIEKASSRELFKNPLHPYTQDPYASLNPRMTVSETIGQPMMVNKICLKQLPCACAAAAQNQLFMAYLLHGHCLGPGQTVHGRNSQTQVIRVQGGGH